jgi:plastocyanin
MRPGSGYSAYAVGRISGSVTRRRAERPRLLRALAALAATALVLACSAQKDDLAGAGALSPAAPGGAVEVRATDDCDPMTFGLLCNPAFNGDTTVGELRAELQATRRVNAWKYSASVTVKTGSDVQVVSRGGEAHTFTVVGDFGGGRIPSLNQASGNPVPAPECLQAPGPRNLNLSFATTQTVTTGLTATLPAGHYKIQCCIHPWMRTEIDVRN